MKKKFYFLIILQTTVFTFLFSPLFPSCFLCVIGVREIYFFKGSNLVSWPSKSYLSLRLYKLCN